tara:strand:- start:4621 stop:5877 length:1257 start_codon:yes stop_codon:yes gene_type:complete
MIKKVLISHVSGNQNSKNLIVDLYKKKKLFKYVTSINFNTKKFPLNLLPQIIKNVLNKRSIIGINENKIITKFFFFEIFNLIKLRIFKNIFKNSKEKYSSLTSEYIQHQCDKIDLLSSKVIKKNYLNISAIYAYEMGAYNTFKEAKKYDIKCIYELPTPYWREREKKISQELKSYKNTDLRKITLFYKKKKTKFFKKLDSEIQNADIIIVPSNYVKKTILKSKFNYKKILVAPYGFPKPISKKKWFNRNNKIEILFVGSLVPNKGILCLLKTIKVLSKINQDKFNLTIVGSGPLENLLKQKLPNSTFKKYLSHNQLLKEMEKKDIFLFPTLYEGLSLSLSEAMSRGMVVISTANSGLLEFGNKSNSILVKVNDHNQIAKKISFLINNPQKVKYLGMNAIETSKKYNWQDFSKKVIDLI